MRADGETAPHLAQRRLNARGGIEAEGLATREHDRVDHLDRIVGRKQLGLARTGSATENLNGGRRRRIAKHGRNPGFQPDILSIADQQSGHVRDQISGPFPHHSILSVAVASTKRPSCHRISL
jgi:hypothetical protein